MKMNTVSSRYLIHYFVAFIIISIYGVQVCPFLERVGSLELSFPVAVAISLQYFLRRIVIESWVDKAPLIRQMNRLFLAEGGLFVTSGLIASSFTTLFYQFPIDSGLRFLFGFLVIGFFVATDLALERERQIGLFLAKEGQSLELDQSFISLVKKFTLFATASILYLVVIFFLMISVDLAWLKGIGDTISLDLAQRYILTEFVFVGLILLVYVLLVIYAFSRNLKQFFDHQNGVLQAATLGDLQSSVPVSSNNEFGVMAHHTNQMIKTLYQRTEELQQTRDVTIHSLASLAETRDNETGAHILRTQRYIRALAIALQNHPDYQHELTDENIELLYKSAPLHDIGKVGIPDAILLKPGKLTADEFVIMKTHASLGAEALIRAEADMGESSFLRYAREIAETHHEKWDGSGYPNGLSATQIPLSGRLMAVADVYDALISKRVYKPAFSHDKAVAMIVEGKGKHFDPSIVEAMLAIEQEFKDIAAAFRDEVAE